MAKYNIIYDSNDIIYEKKDLYVQFVKDYIWVLVRETYELGPAECTIQAEKGWRQMLKDELGNQQKYYILYGELNRYNQFKRVYELIKRKNGSNYNDITLSAMNAWMSRKEDEEDDENAFDQV